MATGKRFYWIKLKDSFITSDAVDYLMSMPDGASYVVIYQMLLLKTINTGGRLSRQIGEVTIPYDVKKITRDFKYFTEEQISSAINYFNALGLMYDDDGVLVMTDHSSMVGSETDYAEKNRRSRSINNAKDVSANVSTVCPDCVHECVQDVSANVSIEKEIRDRDRDKEIEIDTPKVSKSNTISYLSVGERVEALSPSDLARQSGDIDALKAEYGADAVEAKLAHLDDWMMTHPKAKGSGAAFYARIKGWLAEDRSKAKHDAEMRTGGSIRQTSAHAYTQRQYSEDELESLLVRDLDTLNAT